MLPGMSGFMTERPSQGSQIYDIAGSYTFTVPVGVTQISLLVIGGAGGGASGWTTQTWADKFSYEYTNYYGGDGGSGAQSTLDLGVTGGTDVTITVGAGGAGGASTTSYSYANPGSPGNDTFIEYNSFEVARADAGEGGTRLVDGAGGLASASTGDTTTDGVQGDGGAGGFGQTQAGQDGSDGYVVVEW